MVVLDSNPSMDELISITAEDVDRLKHSKSYVRVGTTLTRRELLQLALMSSENRAANSLARTYVGGRSAFINAVNEKIKALGMTHTMIGEPTGLSPNNVSTASDLAKMAAAASRYPLITSITSHSSAIIKVRSRDVMFHNTNRLVGRPEWKISLSKTGFTNEARHCLIMRVNQKENPVTLVLLDGNDKNSNYSDATRILDFLKSQKSLKTVNVSSDQQSKVTANSQIQTSPGG